MNLTRESGAVVDGVSDALDQRLIFTMQRLLPVLQGGLLLP